MAQKFKIKKGDQVVVITGRGINMVKRHRRATQTDAGGIISMEAPLHISNVAHVDPESGKPTRVRREEKDGKKIWVAQRSGKALA